MKRFFRFTAPILIALLLIVNFLPTVETLLPAASFFKSVYADEYENVTAEKNAKEEEKRKKAEEAARIAAEEAKVSGQIGNTQAEINQTEEEIDQKEEKIENLSQQKQTNEQILATKQAAQDEALRSFYKLSRFASTYYLFSSKGLSDITRQWKNYKSSLAQVLSKILFLNGEIQSLKADLGITENQKVALEGEKAVLGEQKQVLEVKKSELQQFQSNLQQEISSLEGEIASLTAKQEELIRAKLSATANFTSIGEYEAAKQSLPSPPFSPAYAFASIGYPHRVGMSQYGAYGRAKAGQSYREILNAYYNAELNENYPVPDQINVEGYGWMSFEGQYLKGIAEMPTSWASTGGYEALKAQAIAARSYALAVTGGGQYSICTTQYCQVYNNSKAFSGDATDWHKAVEETRGQVLTSGGAPITAYYASTAGGYTRLPTDFDVKWNKTSPFLKRIKDYASDGLAWDGPGHGNSPWYYRVWYSASDSHPWLSADEMRDLLNASLLPEELNGSLSHPDNGGWSYDQVRQKLDELGIKKIDNINDLHIAQSDEGYTMLVRVDTSSGAVDVDGRRLRQIFTLRSRGNLALWSSLFDIIKR